MTESFLLALIAAEGGTDLSIGKQVLKEWYLILPLVLASIAVMVIGIERFLFLKKADEQAAELHDQVMQRVNAGGKSQEILALAEQGFSGGIYKALYEGPFHPQVTAAAMERSRSADVAACKRALWFVGTMGNLAPFFGLFGTVIGIINAFIDMAKSGGAGGLAVVGPGIATALIATAAGILVGIFSVFIFNFLNVKIGKLGTDLKHFAEGAYEARLLRLSQQPRPGAPAAAPGRRASDAPASQGAAAP